MMLFYRPRPFLNEINNSEHPMYPPLLVEDDYERKAKIFFKASFRLLGSQIARSLVRCLK